MNVHEFLNTYLGGNKNISTLTYDALAEMLADYAKALQLQQTGVSGSAYAIYYDYFGTKMWLSPKDSRFPDDEEELYTCVSHPFRRFTFTESELPEMILELTKKHPTNIWLYAVV